MHSIDEKKQTQIWNAICKIMKSKIQKAPMKGSDGLTISIIRVAQYVEQYLFYDTYLAISQ
jgi:hypothetical protein